MEGIDYTDPAEVVGKRTAILDIYLGMGILRDETVPRAGRA